MSDFASFADFMPHSPHLSSPPRLLIFDCLTGGYISFDPILPIIKHFRVPDEINLNTTHLLIYKTGTVNKKQFWKHFQLYSKSEAAIYRYSKEQLFSKLPEKLQENTCNRDLQLKGSFSGLRQFLATETPLKIMKNAFYFTLNVFYVLNIFKFLP